MRISDWSSDVCSSDLQAKTGGAEAAAPAGPVDARAAKAVGSAVAGTGATDDAGDLAGDQAVATSAPLAANAPCATRIIEGTLDARLVARSEEHTSQLQSLMRISYADFCLEKKKTTKY